MGRGDDASVRDGRRQLPAATPSLVPWQALSLALGLVPARAHGRGVAGLGDVWTEENADGAIATAVRRGGAGSIWRQSQTGLSPLGRTPSHSRRGRGCWSQRGATPARRRRSLRRSTRSGRTLASGGCGLCNWCLSAKIVSPGNSNVP